MLQARNIRTYFKKTTGVLRAPTSDCEQTDHALRKTGRRRKSLSAADFSKMTRNVPRKFSDQGLMVFLTGEKRES